MSIILPFQAIRPKKELVSELACPPYDVVTREEVRKLIQNKPYSFLRVIRSDGEWDNAMSEYADVVYSRAKDNFHRFLQDGILFSESKPCFYVYAETQGTHTQCGLVCCVSVEEYVQNLIKKHEKTRSEKEADRTRHIDELSIHTEPVFLTYAGNSDLDQEITSITGGKTEYDFCSEDGVRHRLWVVSEDSKIQSLSAHFSKIPALYIADGHHRAASSVSVGLERRRKNKNHTGREQYNFFMAVLFPAEQLKILPYNRVIKDLNGLSSTQFLEKIKKFFDVKIFPEKSNYIPEKEKCFGMYFEHRWYPLTAKDEIYKNKDLVAALDVSLLQDFILVPILGIQDPRTDKRIDFVGGIKGPEALMRYVDTDTMKVAFLLHPTSIQSLMKVSNQDCLMPPKSTWFEPKLKSGLFIHALEERE
jgi:uncharacterized protein (DUF1015 family)